MRIAIAGSHAVGKTTLAQGLADALAGHVFVPEPYCLLEDEGHEFEALPSVEDFERQLERSFQALAEAGADAVFDRCPLDMLGYLAVHRDAVAFDLDDWMPRVREAMSTIDLVVFVPVEAVDRVGAPREQARLRLKVDDALRGIVVDDEHGLELRVLEVAGTPEARLRQVLARTGEGAP